MKKNRPFNYFLLMGTFLLLNTSVTLSVASPVFPEPAVEKLPSGGKIFLFKDQRYPVFEIRVHLDGGHRLDNPGKTGTAKILSQLIDQEADCDDDAISLSSKGLSSNFRPVVTAIITKLFFPDLSNNQVNAHRNQLLESLGGLREAPESLASIALHQNITSDPWLFRGSELRTKETKKVVAADVQKLFTESLVPERLTFSLIGSFSTADVDFLKNEIKTATAKLGKPKKTRKIGKPGLIKSTASKQPILIPLKELNHAHLKMGLLFDPIPKDEITPILVGHAILGELPDARLQKSLVIEGGALSMTSALFIGPDVNSWIISTDISPAKVFETIQQVEKTVKSWLAQGPTNEEVESAKKYLLGAYPVGLANFPSYASRWLFWEQSGIGGNMTSLYWQKIPATTSASIFSLYKKALKGKNFLSVIVGNPTAIKKAWPKNGKPFPKQVGPKALL